jgi:hypothetical protein
MKKKKQWSGSFDLPKKKKQKTYKNVLAMVKDLIRKDTVFYKKLKAVIAKKELEEQGGFDERDISYNPTYPYDTKAGEDLFSQEETGVPGNGLFGREHK